MPTSAVKAEATHLRPRYRNEAVFRSAERLLASPPPSHSPIRRSRRGLYFAAGLLCGIALTFLVRWTASRNPPATELASSATSAQAPRNLPAPRPVATLPSAHQPAQPATAVEAVSETLLPNDASADSAATRQPKVTVIPRPAAPANTAAKPYVIQTLTTFTSSIVLRGTMESESPATPPLEVEFLLLFEGKGGTTVQGHVRISDESVLKSFHRVSGIYANGTVTISEPIVRRNGLFQPLKPFRFVIRLHPNGVIASGTWHNGGARGTLALNSIPTR